MIVPYLVHVVSTISAPVQAGGIASPHSPARLPCASHTTLASSRARSRQHVLPTAGTITR
jgi:hypothetical protein